MQKNLIITISAAGILIAAAIIFLPHLKNNAPVMQMPPAEVGVVTLKSETVALENELSGRVKPSLQSDVRPQVDGIIEKQLFNEGDFVKAGTVLYKIDSQTYQALYNQALAALNSAKANISAAKLKAERYAELLEHNGVSRQDYDDATASYQQAQATVQEREAALETAKINLERADIKAPIAGYIGISNFTPGALVTANQATPLAVIRATDNVYVDMVQSASQLVKMRLLPENSSVTKQSTVSVKLKLENGSIYKHKGLLKIQEVAVDEDSGSVTLRAQFPNPEGLLMPGMYVRTLVNGAHANDIVMLDQRAVSFDAKGNATVYVVNGDNKVELRSIKTGPEINGKWPVMAALNANEKVIVEGTAKVSPGQTVLPVEVE